MGTASAAVRIVEAAAPPPMPVGEQMAANRAAVEAAEREHLEATIGSVEWERRGVFGRLVPKGAR
jgi:hypothetical protein